MSSLENVVSDLLTVGYQPYKDPMTNNTNYCKRFEFDGFDYLTIFVELKEFEPHCGVVGIFDIQLDVNNLLFEIKTSNFLTPNKYRGTHKTIDTIERGVINLYNSLWVDNLHNFDCEQKKDDRFIDASLKRVQSNAEFVKHLSFDFVCGTLAKNGMSIDSYYQLLQAKQYDVCASLLGINLDKL